MRRACAALCLLAYCESTPVASPPPARADRQIALPRGEHARDAPCLVETRNGLSIRTRADARAFAEAFFKRDESALPSERLDHFERELSDFFGHVGGRARLLFLACLATATWGAPLLVTRPFTRLAALSITDRIAALEALERVPVAQLALYALKAIASIMYYEHPDAAAEIGWDRRCLGKKALPVITEQEA